MPKRRPPSLSRVSFHPGLLVFVLAAVALAPGSACSNKNGEPTLPAVGFEQEVEPGPSSAGMRTQNDRPGSDFETERAPQASKAKTAKKAKRAKQAKKKRRSRRARRKRAKRRARLRARRRVRARQMRARRARARRATRDGRAGNRPTAEDEGPSFTMDSSDSASEDVVALADIPDDENGNSNGDDGNSNGDDASGETADDAVPLGDLDEPPADEEQAPAWRSVPVMVGGGVVLLAGVGLLLRRKLTGA